MRTRPSAQVDLFSPTPYLGNPVAVVLDGEELDDEAMLRVARWTNRVPSSYHVSQGRRLGRAGDITVTADADGTVWVGGATTTLFRVSALVRRTSGLTTHSRAAPVTAA